ncbi:hypothetical protein APSETT444_002479 [Aspergillus pseudonomiae]
MGIDPSDFTITTTNANDKTHWSKFTALKKKKPSLKTYISVGGWDVGGKVFSDMVRFPGTRKAFIDSAISMMTEYGFDGIDIDWEYPAAEDRGYLKGFNIADMAKYIDHFNFMSYDIHGTWDGRTSKWTSSVVNPHTNLTEISAGLDLLWRNGVEPSKVLLGLGFYGRSFKLADATCNTPGCDFYTENHSTGGAVAGECTGTSGFLSDYEINRIISDYSVDVHYDEAAAVNWMTWSGDQWVSFDNGHTLKQKADFANGKCLGGLFSWALDLGGPGSMKNPNGMTADDTSMDGASAEGGSDGTGLLYAGQEIFGDSPTVTAIAPVSIIFPKSVMSTPTTIDFGAGYPTSLEVAWRTTKTVTVDGIATVTSTVTRYIMPTTIPLPPITTNTVNYYNWNISDIVTVSRGLLIPSFEIPPVVVTNHPNPLNETSVTHSPLATRTCRVVTCSGPGCSNGVCTGKGCKTEDSDCEHQEADSCTAYITSLLVTPVSTYSTTTVTSRCETITACAARPTTVTSTIDKNGLNEGTISNIDYAMSDDPSLASYLDEQLSSFFDSAFATATTTTSTTSTAETTTSSTKTTSTTPTPSETGFECGGSRMCKTFPKIHAFCDMAKSFLKDNTVYG